MHEPILNKTGGWYLALNGLLQSRFCVLQSRTPDAHFRDSKSCTKHKEIASAKRKTNFSWKIKILWYKDSGTSRVALEKDFSEILLTMNLSVRIRPVGTRIAELLNLSHLYHF